MGGNEAGTTCLGYAASRREESATKGTQKETERPDEEAEVAAGYKPYP